MPWSAASEQSSHRRTTRETALSAFRKSLRFAFPSSNKQWVEHSRTTTVSLLLVIAPRSRVGGASFRNRAIAPGQKRLQPLQLRMQPRVGRVEADRFLGGLPRLVRPSQPYQYPAELIANMDVSRVALGRCAVGLFGAGEIAAPQQEVAEMRREAGICRFRRHTGPSRFDGVIETAGPAQGVAEVDLEYSQVRRHDQGLSDLSLGSPVVPGIHQHSPELSITMRICRLDLDRSLPHRNRLGMLAFGAQDLPQLGVMMRSARSIRDDLA